MNPTSIRNFVIIAHIDHGKSTLADRFLELTGAVEKRRMREQYLDRMELEREKGITIKMAPVRMQYKLKVKNEKFKISGSETFNFELFTLNLIDTPGHADFSYEVSRALAAVEGAILLVDAAQGVQAQTVSTLELARSSGLAVIPAINKIDLPQARILETAEELSHLLGVAPGSILRVSAKTGEGVTEVLAAVIREIPPPSSSNPASPPRALIFDSHYDSYRGIVAHVRIFTGDFGRGDKVSLLAARAQAEIAELGIFSPELAPAESLSAGEIGYIATGLKEPEKVRVGDTITKFKVKSLKLEVADEVRPLPGYKEPAAMVFASIFPENQDDFEKLREALEKLKLNDAAMTFEPEEASALGRGFRAGFLGMLHMEIASERLRREYNLKLIFANPSVAFKIKTKRGEVEIIQSAAKLPPAEDIEEIREPWARLEVITPPQFLGAISRLVNERGGSVGESAMLASDRMMLYGMLPLRDVIIDFHDRVKSISQGFASLAYETGEWRASDLVRLDICIAGSRLPVLAEIGPRAKAAAMARERVK
ncbi:MAG: translation elongation factor 4, partial [Patescibacteria group bacterium]